MKAKIKILPEHFYASLKCKDFAHLIALSCITLGSGLATALPPIEPVLAAGVVGNGTPSSCNEAALNTALAGGGIVTFNCGSSPVTIKVTSEKKIASDTLIDGKSLITLDGGRKTRIFKVEDNGVPFAISGLTIVNGFTTDQGGAILSGYRSKLTVVKCKFNNNLSTNSGKFAGGGAIYAKSESTVFIDKSTFTGNRAGNGGAINNLLSNLTVTNSTFTSNKSVVSGSGGGGGAIYIDGANGDNGKIILRGNNFVNNTAIFQGGAIFSQLYNSNTNTIENSTFSGNSVTGGGNQGFGGAIYSIGGTLTLAPAYAGGANNALLTVTSTTFSSNKASNQGGAIWNGNSATLNITNSTIFGNSAVSGDRKGGQGGGIMRTSGKINITNSTIAGNYVGFQGGGIYGSSPDITLRNTIIANNKANNGGNKWNIKNNCGSYPSVPMTNGGNNLEYPQKNLSDPSDINCASGITIADPKLGPLANNGGSTQTMRLLAGSAAINAGNNATCSIIDQRGVKRPLGSTCDIGAFEAK